jgi:hypothetical protein
MNLNRRNYPPDHGIRVPFDALRSLVVSLFERVDMPTSLLGICPGVCEGFDDGGQEVEARPNSPHPKDGGCLRA